MHAANFPKILIVDDLAANLRLLAGILELEEYSIRPALSGKIALEAALADPPDLILLDVAMPEISGFDVCASLKKDMRTKNIPIIFISAKNSSEDIIKGFKVGGIDYIAKPFHAEEVLVKVRTHLSLYMLQAELNERTLMLEHEIRERKKLELDLKNLRAYLLSQEKMVGMGHLAAAAPYELDNSLDYINSNFSVLNDYFTKMEKMMDGYHDAMTAMADTDNILFLQHMEKLHAMKKDLNLDDIFRERTAIFEKSEDGLQQIAEMINTLRVFSTH